MISFEITGGQKAAFEFMNQLKLIKLAVSLGSTESLIQHPATMTHVGVAADLKMKLGINDNLIRLSVGIEHFEDVINDMSAAFELVTTDETELMATY